MFPFNIFDKYEGWFLSRKYFLETVFLIVIVFAIIYIALDFNDEMKDDQTNYFCYNKVPNNTVFRKIWNKLYMSFTTLTTLGFGDIYPIHPISQSITAFQSFIAFALVTEFVK